MRAIVAVCLGMLGFGVAASDAQAGPINLITNGSFSINSSSSVSTEVSSNYSNGTAVTGWSSSGYNLWFVGGTQTSVSALNQYNDPKTYFYTTFANLSPDGGDFMALDGDSGLHGALTQQLSALTAGTDYTLTFYWAATQLVNRSGPTTEQLQVSLGNQTQLTQVLSNPTGGFTGCSSQQNDGWCKVTMTFEATSASELLSFLSLGTPNGQPPIAVLDGVSMYATPEPASLAVMLVGIGLVGAAAQRRKTRRQVSTP